MPYVRTRIRLPPAADLVALLAAVASLALVTFVYGRWIGVTNPTIVALSFLLIVLVAAAASALWVAIVTSLAAFGCFNFFFLPPVGTFTIADPQNWVALFTLLAVSVVASHLSTQARRRAEDATARRDEVSRLFDLTRDILLTTDARDAVTLVARYIARRFGFLRVAICLPGPEGWQLHQSGEHLTLDEHRLDAALQSARTRLEFDAREGAYSGHTRVETSGGAAVWLVPLRLGTRPIGLLALEGADVEAGTRDTIAGVTAIAIERAQLLEEREEAAVVRRSAELNSALLASFSHDLRTPLTAVTVAASNLNASWLTDEQRRDQTEIILTELEHLNRLFENIVDMARIETHAVTAEPEWVTPAEIVEAAARQVEHVMAGHSLELDSGTDRMLVRVDPRLTSAALAHLLENAAQYSPAGSAIAVCVMVAADEIRISVRDRGPGIAPPDLDHLFDRFYRGVKARRRRFGTGMGLAITRGLLAAEGGRVWAENHAEGGAVFTLAVPAQVRPEAALEGESL